jgi:hypothetical protein
MSTNSLFLPCFLCVQNSTAIALRLLDTSQAQLKIALVWHLKNGGGLGGLKPSFLPEPKTPAPNKNVFRESPLKR